MIIDLQERVGFVCECYRSASRAYSKTFRLEDWLVRLSNLRPGAIELDDYYLVRDIPYVQAVQREGGDCLNALHF